MREKIKSLFRKNKELIRYLIFGALTTAVNFAVYTAAMKAGMSDEMTGANLVAWICAVIFAFFANKLFVFESKSFKIKTVLPEALTFIGARVLSGVLEVFLPEALVNLGLDTVIFGIEGLVAKAAVSVAVIILNYIFSKLVIFRKKEIKK